MNKLSKSTVAICFNILQVGPFLLPFGFAVSFTRFNVLSGYFNVSLNLLAIPGHCLNFDNFFDTAPLSDTGYQRAMPVSTFSDVVVRQK